MKISGIRASVLGLIFGVVSYVFLIQKGVFWPAGVSFLAEIFLGAYFFLMMIVVQQEEEEFSEKILRIGSATLFSFIVFMQLLYAPIARYFFGQLIQKSFFLSDLLALFLFLMFFFLFGTTAVISSSFSRNGIFTGWNPARNEILFAILKIFWPSAAIFAIFLYINSPFIIISASR